MDRKGVIELYKILDDPKIKEAFEFLMPELKESEDERIRKEMLDFFKQFYDIKNVKFVDVEPWIAWLEKQGSQQLATSAKTCKVEQKSAEWSDEDEKMLNDAIGAVGAADYYTYDDKQEIENWLKLLKNRVQPQTKSDWNNNDEDFVSSLITELDEIDMIMNTKGEHEDHSRIVEWLKSLKDRVHPQWKPSEEQIEALKAQVEDGFYGPLSQLYYDLKKLRGE